MAIGRISGPLLKQNLIRNGTDLAFETDLLYLDVNNSRIGVNTSTPAADLHVNDTLRTTNLIVDNQFDIGKLHFSGNTISSDIQTISFQPSGSDPTIYHSKLRIDDIEITDNVISTIDTNADLTLEPNGTGKVDIRSDATVNGDLYVTGDINADGNVTIGGNITIGDSLTDTITINAAIKSDLIPETDITYDLGSSTFKWRNIYSYEMEVDILTLNDLNVGDIEISGNTISTKTNTDLSIFGTGTGSVRLANFEFDENTITNITPNGISRIIQTGTSYIKFEGTNGFVPPRGTDIQRPTSYAVLGMTRYNTTSKSLEVWDGITWASPAGASGAVSEFQANDISIAWALTLG